MSHRLDTAVPGVERFSSVIVLRTGLCQSTASLAALCIYFNPLGPRPDTALSQRNPLRREVTVSNDPGIQLVHQTKISARFVFFPICKYSVLVIVYPTGLDFFH